jgi:hypothetical protein
MHSPAERVPARFARRAATGTAQAVRYECPCDAASDVADLGVPGELHPVDLESRHGPDGYSHKLQERSKREERTRPEPGW